MTVARLVAWMAPRMERLDLDRDAGGFDEDGGRVGIDGLAVGLDRPAGDQGGVGEVERGEPIGACRRDG